MTILHMETEVVKALASQFNQKSQQMQQDIQTLLGQIENMSWQSTSRDEFVAEFGNLSQKLSKQTENGSILSSRLEREVAKWEDCAAGMEQSKIRLEPNWGDRISIISEDPIFPHFPHSEYLTGEDGQPPTLMMGEDGHPPTLVMGEEGHGTSMALGEEGQITNSIWGEAGEGPTRPGYEEGHGQTLAMGEDGYPLTLPIGEDGHATSMTLGEEGQVVSIASEDPIQTFPKGEPVTSLSLGEEGQVFSIISEDPVQTFPKGEPVTSLSLGEEGQVFSLISEDPIQIQPDIAQPSAEIHTMAYPEDGVSRTHFPDTQDIVDIFGDSSSPDQT